MVGTEARAGPRRPIPHTENSIRQASRPRCSGGHVHAPDNCLKRIGGDILEMSCAGIISIPLVLACMQSVRAMERAEQGEEEEGHLLNSSYYRFHRRGTIGLDTGCSKAGHHFCQPFKVRGRRATMATSGGRQFGLRRRRRLGKAAR